MQEVLVETIRTDGAVQSREKINAEYVKELSEQIEAGKKLPPVDVYKSGAETWLADGFHRLRAHEAAGKRTIQANVHKGNKEDAAWHSAGANLTHGLKRTNDDKRNAVEMALKLKPSSSDRLISDHCGVSPSTVARIRAEMKMKNQVSNLDTCPRIGKDGKKYPPVPSGKPTVKQEQQQPQPVTPKPKQAPAVPVDAVGYPIPDYLQELYDRGAEVTTLIGSLKAVRSEVNRGVDSLWAECDRQRAVAGLEQAISELAATVPYAVCPWCHGAEPMRAGCKGCGGRGLIGQFRYDNAVPAEMK